MATLFEWSQYDHAKRVIELLRRFRAISLLIQHLVE